MMAGVDVAGGPPRRRVGFLLGFGIFLLPFIFAWFTLRRGYSTLARVLSFGWMGFLIIVAIVAPPAPVSNSTGAKTNSADASRASAASSADANATSSGSSLPPPAAVAGRTPLAPFRIGDVEVGVTKIVLRRKTTALTPEGDDTGQKLLVVDYTVSNLGAKTMKVPEAVDAPHLIDAAGKSHDRALFKSLAALLEAGHDAEPKDGLAPGASIRSVVVFDVSHAGFDPKTWSLSYDGGPNLAIK
jgi:hypothetical protein